MAGKSESTGAATPSDVPDSGSDVASARSPSEQSRAVAEADASLETDAAQFVTPWRLRNWQVTALTASLVFCGLLAVLRFTATEESGAAHTEGGIETATTASASAHESSSPVPPGTGSPEPSPNPEPSAAASATASQIASAAASSAHVEPPMAEPSASTAHVEPPMAEPSASTTSSATSIASPHARAPAGDSKSGALETQPCRSLDAPRRLASPIDADVPLMVVPYEAHLRIGYSDGTAAIGLKWAPRERDAQILFSEQQSGAIAGVQPLTHHSDTPFAVDLLDRRRAGGYSLDARGGYRLMPHPKGMALADEKQKAELLWKYVPHGGDSRPLVVPLGNSQFAVVVQRGGASATTVLSVLDVEAQQAGVVTELRFKGSQVGRPDLAVSGSRILVAVAVRGEAPPELEAVKAASKPSAPPPRGKRRAKAPNVWRLQLAELQQGRERVIYTPLSRFPNGGKHALAPKVAALPGGRWLLQWTVGEAGGRSVRVVTLDSNLKPLHDPLIVSPEDGDAGAGKLSGGDLPASLYLTQVSRGYELWAQPLECGLGGGDGLTPTPATPSHP